MPDKKKIIRNPALDLEALQSADLARKIINDSQAPLRALVDHQRMIAEANKSLDLHKQILGVHNSNTSVFESSISPFIREMKERQQMLADIVRPMAARIELGASIARSIADQLKPSREFIEMMNSFAVNLQRLGEIAIDFDIDDEEQQGELSLNIGEEAANRLIQVDFLPLHIIRAIVKDPSLLLQTSSRDFERRMASLLEKLGFESVQLTQASKDGGIDIWASHTFNGIPSLFAFDCKRWAPNRKIESADMKVMLGTVETTTPKPDKGVILTTSTFTKGAWNLVANQTNLWGRDLQGIIEWMKIVKDSHGK